MPEIARELDVDAVVEGTVMRSGDRVRISGLQSWAAQKYNGTLATAENRGKDSGRIYVRCDLDGSSRGLKPETLTVVQTAAER